MSQQLVGHFLKSVEQWNFFGGGWQAHDHYVLDPRAPEAAVKNLVESLSPLAASLGEAIGMDVKLVVDKLDDVSVDSTDEVVWFELRPTETQYENLAPGGGLQLGFLKALGLPNVRQILVLEDFFCPPAVKGLRFTYGDLVQSWLYQAGKLEKMAADKLFRAILKDDVSVEYGDEPVLKKRVPLGWGSTYVVTREYDFLLTAVSAWLAQASWSQKGGFYALDEGKVLRLYYDTN